MALAHQRPTTKAKAQPTIETPTKIPSPAPMISAAMQLVKMCLRIFTIYRAMQFVRTRIAAQSSQEQPLECGTG